MEAVGATRSNDEEVRAGAVSLKTLSRRGYWVFRTGGKTVGSRWDQPWHGNMRFKSSVGDNEVYTANRGRPKRKCRLNMDLLSERAAMLADVRDEVSAMKRVLAEILSEVRVSR